MNAETTKLSKLLTLVSENFVLYNSTLTHNTKSVDKERLWQSWKRDWNGFTNLYPN